jgi:two-component system, cell cycle sensor histidine kinase and response regulator CckA
VRNHASAIHVAVTDVVMPHMSGGELATELGRLRYDTRVLFVSGYAGQTVLNHNVIDVENNFLQKPFSLKQLAGKVRTILDQDGKVAPMAVANVEETRMLTAGSGSVFH